MISPTQARANLILEIERLSRMRTRFEEAEQLAAVGAAVAAIAELDPTEIQRMAELIFEFPDG